MRFLIFCFVFTSLHSFMTAMADDIIIKATYLVDGEANKAVNDREVLVRDGKIVEISTTVDHSNNPEIIDIAGHTILPGFIDVHTHVMMNEPDDYGEELYKKSHALRALQTIPNLRTSLMNGFTTLRDVGNEGSMFTDVDVQTALKKGWIVGPRLLVSTRAISTIGRYDPNDYNHDLNLPKGNQWVVGVDEGIRAVREQISGGADWIKIYADWGQKISPDGNLHGSANFTQRELDAMVAEVHRYERKVAVHAQTVEGIKAALDAGADSIEHGQSFNGDLIKQAKKQGTVWVPTLHGYEEWLPLLTGKSAYTIRARLSMTYKNLKLAYKEGLPVALGTDAGSTKWDNNQAKEFEHLVTGAGFSEMDAIKAGTSVGADLLDMEDEIGRLKVGMVADIVAVKGNPLDDITLLQSVCLVIQGGKVVKNECGE